MRLKEFNGKNRSQSQNAAQTASIIRMIKTRRMRRAGHVARMGENMNVYRIYTKT
jgi:hypothetical protein